MPSKYPSTRTYRVENELPVLHLDIVTNIIERLYDEVKPSRMIDYADNRSHIWALGKMWREQELKYVLQRYALCSKSCFDAIDRSFSIVKLEYETYQWRQPRLQIQARDIYDGLKPSFNLLSAGQAVILQCQKVSLQAELAGMTEGAAVHARCAEVDGGEAVSGSEVSLCRTLSSTIGRGFSDAGITRSRMNSRIHDFDGLLVEIYGLMCHDSSSYGDLDRATTDRAPGRVVCSCPTDSVHRSLRLYEILWEHFQTS